MHNFGFKVVDKNPELLGPVLDYAIHHGRPLEVGLYYGDSQALELLERRLFNAPTAVNAHTDHERFHVFNLHRTQNLLSNHIRTAKTLLGSAYSVIHTANLPMTLSAVRRPALMNLLLANLERAQELCVVHDYRLYLENVFHPVAFYRELFEGVHARGLSHIHFCFDIGHAKVWSADSLDEWLEFIEELAAMGVGLHCHLHANHGFADDHLSMQEVEEHGLGEADGYYNAYGYPAAFWVIENRFPSAAKVFEVRSDQAIANLEAVVAARIAPDAALAPATGGVSAAPRRKRLGVKRQQAS